MILDTNKWIVSIEGRIAIESNPTVRRNLETVRQHMIAEQAGDLDGLMATLGDFPVYRQWGAPDSSVLQPRGRVEVYAAYIEFIQSKRGTYLEYDIDRIVADESAVITDGLRKSVFPARVLASPDSFPISNYRVDSMDDLYLVTERQITSWPFDSDGRLTGEEGYRVVLDIRQLNAEETAEVADVFFAV